MRGLAGPAMLAVCMGACGRIAFDAIDADELGEVGGSGELGPPMLIAELSSPADERDPSLTGDLLEIFFESDRPGGSGGTDIWAARRSRATDPWEAPVPVVELNTSSPDGTPEVTPDGLTLYFSSSSTGDLDIWMSTRAARGAPWAAPVRVAELSSSSADRAPAIHESLIVLVMDSNRSGAGRDLFITTRPNPSAPWQPPTHIAELATPEDEADPFLSRDQLDLYFAAGPNGARDLFVAHRPDPTSPFGAAVPLVTLNHPLNDSDPWVSSDGLLFVFASSRSGQSDLYQSVRTSP